MNCSKIRFSRNSKSLLKTALLNTRTIRTRIKFKPTMDVINNILYEVLEYIHAYISPGGAPQLENTQQMIVMFNILCPMIMGWQPNSQKVFPREEYFLLTNISERLGRLLSSAEAFISVDGISDNNRIFCETLIQYLHSISEDQNYKFLDLNPSSGEGSPIGSDASEGFHINSFNSRLLLNIK